MRHLVKGRKFSRVKKQRTALVKTLLGSLIMKEKIMTTEAKAKEIKPIVENMITKAKVLHGDEKKKVAVIRDLQKWLPAVAVKKLSGDFAKKFETRSGGFCRIIKTGQRKSDGAKMAVIEFVN
ncbi:MAG TPA: 50S ribosomal protein L17 [Candidatus Moranbacteria bacterium]|jgi:large subunit ribosomal protein L17|nr:50S ribosomal protein L17 [Candidatus Moranbacteria bacterium]HOF42935.1 50S ribosomal protein L17 [Candidatus Moranbacteria bacterium]HPX94228.1 50S ribosomal protein L17 [Candidatus Moranbacteria bacterium]HQB59683.1 50S ribosomal protein L17 [Candidatus Moranbacteria bacterium]